VAAVVGRARAAAAASVADDAERAA
jgi:hypothetical protein